MEVNQLVGIEKRTYEQNGEVKTFCALHFVSAAGAVQGVDGSSVQSVACPREINPDSLQVGEWYEFGYTHYKTKSGLMARLVSLSAVEVD